MHHTRIIAAAAMGGDAEVPDTMRLGELYPEQLAAGLREAAASRE